MEEKQPLCVKLKFKQYALDVCPEFSLSAKMFTLANGWAVRMKRRGWREFRGLGVFVVVFPILLVCARCMYLVKSVLYLR